MNGKSCMWKPGKGAIQRKKQNALAMRGGNHKQQQHAIYGGRDGGEADTKYKVGGHARSAAGGNYHGSVNVISQARNKPHQFRMVLLNSARFPPTMLFNSKQYRSIPHSLVDETVKPTPLTDSHLCHCIVDN